MTMAFNYESFVRIAFGFPNKMVDRWGDPAELANTDAFRNDNIAAVKAATIYGMRILSLPVLNKEGLSDNECLRLKSFAEKVINAVDVTKIDSLITDFRDTVIDQYFNVADGLLTLK